MNRDKKHRKKYEVPNTSSSSRKEEKEEHDLTYYVNDRIELMHQVFTLIGEKDLKLMSPQCLKNVSLDRLKEICTEEVLGISSKRLTAILNGVQPPSDTESSCNSKVSEPISLDSISSDEEIFNKYTIEFENKAKKKKQHKSKRRSKKRHSKNKDETHGPLKDELNVLEQLEIQDKARIMKSKPNIEQTHKKIPATVVHPSSETETKLTKVHDEVVEISSDEQTDNMQELDKRFKKSSIRTKGRKITEKMMASATDSLLSEAKQVRPARKELYAKRAMVKDWGGRRFDEELNKANETIATRHGKKQHKKSKRKRNKKN